MKPLPLQNHEEPDDFIRLLLWLKRLPFRASIWWSLNQRRIPFTIRTWKQIDDSDGYWSRLNWQQMCETSSAREEARLAIEQRDAMVDALSDARQQIARLEGDFS